MPEDLGLTADILNEAQRETWREKGYLVVRNAAGPELVDRIVSTIWTSIHMSPDAPEEWYSEEVRARSSIDVRGMIPIYHDAPLWESRQMESIYDAFRAVYEDGDLHLFVDRCNMNPPQRKDWRYCGFMHWDIDVKKRPIKTQAQGLLALTDVKAGSGGFQCVPGFHRIIEGWLGKQEAGFDTRFPDVSGFPVENIELSAGDFLIWHGALPHGNTANQSERPRLAQYITMRPKKEVPNEILDLNRRAVQSGNSPVAPGGTLLPEDPRQIQHTVALTPIGKMLLGINSSNES